ncbi:hypothetical protein CIHG_05213 [Coccidioides immitis H538.4]|uniref:Uncharacterized protein n=1 Tax=Coccidioides immitis H538.4 TaxID=396776 RepID=A0A0J8RQP9_COCIT|nr:hypothetical protein CIHG_05213 [Coccidioides immitis H538.4]
MENGGAQPGAPVPHRSGNNEAGRRSRSGSASSVLHKRSFSSSLFSKFTFARMNQSSGNVAERGGENAARMQGEDAGPFLGREILEARAGGGRAMATALQQQIRTRRRKGSLRKTALLGTGVLRMAQKGPPSRAAEVSRDVSPNKDIDRNKDTGAEQTSRDGLTRFPDLSLPVGHDEGATMASRPFDQRAPPRPPTPPVRPSPQPAWNHHPSQGREQPQHQQQMKKPVQQVTSHSASEARSTMSSLRDDVPTDEDDLVSFPPLTNSLSRLSSQTSTSSISALSSLPPRRIPLSIPTLSCSSDSYFPPLGSNDAGTIAKSRPRAPSQRVRSPLATNPAEMASSPEGWDYSETEWWGWIILVVTWVVFVVGMGSCLGVWSWAWDVGETPYAPPELEDDPTLPIVGYYPALIILTAVMAWVWVVVAWMGMKYFRHANISGEDI